MRIRLKDGQVAYGSGVGTGCEDSKSSALISARKCAVTEARKVALGDLCVVALHQGPNKRRKLFVSLCAAESPFV